MLRTTRILTGSIAALVVAALLVACAGAVLESPSRASAYAVTQGEFSATAPGTGLLAGTGPTEHGPRAVASPVFVPGSAAGDGQAGHALRDNNTRGRARNAALTFFTPLRI
jgi:hypothetical protein